MTGGDVLAIDRLSKAFTPNRPVDLPELLSGRLELIYRAQDAINTQGQHVILYGDRGIGKTSIAHVVAVLAQERENPTGRRAILVSCDSNDDYGTIWRKVFQEIMLAERQLGFTQHERASVVGRWNPDDTISSPNDVRLLVRSFPNSTVIIIDEFDRVPVNTNARRLLADTIKLFSDTNTNSTIMIVGVADSISELFAEHKSIERNIAQVPVDPMNLAELAGIIQKGFSSANMTFEPGLDFKIAHLSQGYPHYTHLLGLWCGRKAVERGSSEVTAKDLLSALPAAIQNVAGGIRQDYETAVDSTQPENLFKPVLLACALAEKDSRGRFSIAALREPLQKILKRPSIRPVSYQSHLAKFCEPKRGPVLRRSGTKKNYRWQFINPQLVPFVILEGISSGLLNPDD